MSFEVKVGKIGIGGGNPVSVQSMCNVRTSNVSAVVAQINAAEKYNIIAVIIIQL